MTEKVPFWMSRNMEMLAAENNQLKEQNDEINNALIELANIQGEDEVSIEDLTNAILELAEIIGG